MYSNKYSQKIFEILEPLVGIYVAKAVIKTQSSKIGSDEESLTKNHLPKLAEGIRSGLNIFLGTETSSKISESIAKIQ